MKRPSGRPYSLVLALALAGLGAAGCTGPGPAVSHPPVTTRPTAPASPARAELTAFRSCDDVLAGLRQAASASVGPDGLPGDTAPVTSFGAEKSAGGAMPAAAPGAGNAAAGNAAAAPAASPDSASGSAARAAFSGTNTAVPGVDEPDLVKTDGQRIVTIEGSTLTVVDAASRQVTGTLILPLGIPGANPGGVAVRGPVPAFSGSSASLLLSGDHALVLASGYAPARREAPDLAPFPRASLLLIDLSSAQPQVISSYAIDGTILDARQVGSVARVVTKTAPRVVFPAMPPGASQAQRIAANQAAIARAGTTAWLPGYTSTGGGSAVSGTVGCTSVSRPAGFSGASMLTVGTFDLSSPVLGTGNPVSVEADGDTVYGTGSSLYIASGNEWTGSPATGDAATAGPAAAGARSLPAPLRQRTEIYRFDVSGSAPPRYTASGSVPGYLIDQYALSELGGYLRVATSTGLSWATADGPSPLGTAAPPSSSAVYVLSLAGSSMPVVGEVTGLGAGERIYSVRFLGTVGYVVTFRQTDPLYTVDLSDPVEPRVVGSLSLTGYSAYLHPVSVTQLIGVGESADAMGHRKGTQVSLFDVANLASPALQATYALPGTSSAVEFDPHAFLYWPDSGLVVVPLDGSSSDGDLVLRVSGATLTRVGLVRQLTGWGSIQRSLIIGQTLWTVSGSGLMATSLPTLRESAWLPYPVA